MVSEPTKNGATVQRWVRPLLLVMGAVVFFCLVAVTVMAIQLRSSNRQLDDLDEAVADIDDAVSNIDSFVVELQEEREAGDGVTTEELRVVFGLVRDQLTLLCTQFPDDPVCLQG